jgi:hypothetical protein
MASLFNGSIHPSGKETLIYRTTRKPDLGEMSCSFAVAGKKVSHRAYRLRR